MTKKEELLEFISSSVNETNYLRTVERIVTPANVDSFLHENDAGNKTFSIPKESLVDAITNDYDDNLIGSVGNDQNITQILYWYTVDR